TRRLKLTRETVHPEVQPLTYSFTIVPRPELSISRISVRSRVRAFVVGISGFTSSRSRSATSPVRSPRQYTVTAAGFFEIRRCKVRVEAGEESDMYHPPDWWIVSGILLTSLR